MRWKGQPSLALGDTRVKRRFAWFPTVMENNVIIWLERYDDHQRVIEAFDSLGGGCWLTWKSVRRTQQ